MHNEFFSRAHELLTQGVPFATALVVRAEKPTSAKPGDKVYKWTWDNLKALVGGAR